MHCILGSYIRVSTDITFMIGYAPFHLNNAFGLQILFEIAVYRPEKTAWIVGFVNASSAFAIIHKSIVLVAYIASISLRHIISERKI